MLSAGSIVCHYYVHSVYRTKGCVPKNEDVYFGAGRSVADIAEVNLPGGAPRRVF